MNGAELQTAFFGITPDMFLFVAGRFAVMIASYLLLIKHLVWAARGYYTRYERREKMPMRAWIEATVSGVLAVIYTEQLYIDGVTVMFAQWESIIILWAVAFMLFTMVLARKEGRPTE